MSANSASGKRRAAPGSFSTTVARILELPRQVTGDDNVNVVLKEQLDRLPKAWRDKLGQLLNLGRKVHERSHVYSSIPEGHGVTPLDASALCHRETRTQQYLERGLAMMLSQSLDLESAEAPAQGGDRKTSVFERAWSHFGRELASSEPDEWTWFAQRASRTERLEKIYLRRGDRGWWSFGVGLDRPQKSQVGSQQAKASRGRRGDSGTGLQSLVAHQYSSRRALGRAMRSVHARMGIIAALGPPTSPAG